MKLTEDRTLSKSLVSIKQVTLNVYLFIWEGLLKMNSFGCLRGSSNKQVWRKNVPVKDF